MRINRTARRVLPVLTATALMLAVASPAAAHDGTGLVGGFVAGVTHPLSGPDHMLAMISVGLWGAFLGRPLIYTLPMIFPTVMALGAGIGMIGVPFPPVEIGIALSVLTLGVLILFAVRAQAPVACAIVAIFGLFHGYAHGVELPSAADPIGYSTGFVLCTGLLHLAGIAIGMIKSSSIGTLALRGAGGVVAVVGVMFWIRALTA